MQGIYIHIPFCLRKCDYCAFVSKPASSAVMEQYIGKLIEQIRAQGGGKADTVYIGGGTPSVLSLGQITRVLDAVRAAFSLEIDSEITIECNPETLTEQKVKEYADAGVNRFSLGLQSANDKLTALVGRHSTAAEYLRAVEMIFAHTDNISADMMLGLCNQTIEDAQQTARFILDSNVCHVSLYSLKCEENTPLYKTGYVVDDDLCADMYESVYTLLTENGFERYEVSNLCKNQRISRHNYKYWSYEDYIGFGVAAHSKIGDCRFENTSKLFEYAANPLLRAKTQLSKEQMQEEFLMLALRTERGLDLGEYQRRFGIDFIDKKGDAVSRLASGGFVFLDNGFLRVCKNSFYVLNSIIVELM